MTFSLISFSAWNINGLSNKVLGDKLHNNDFLDSINNCDFVALSEIWNRSHIEIQDITVLHLYQTNQILPAGNPEE